MSTNRTALVLGASGGVGGEVAAALLRRGWIVKGLARDPESAAKRWSHGAGRPVWLKGDALDRQSVVAAAQGCSVVVHAVNPPGYRDWDKVVLPMLDITIAAARAAGARIALPGTVYNFGPGAFANPVEDAPQNPVTRKGAIRVDMEKRLRVAAKDGAPALILRCGDFFGAHAANNWFSQGLIKPGKPVSSISYPGANGVGHQWAYLPDVGETMARLIERREEMAAFDVYHMEGHWDHDGKRMIEAIRGAVGNPQLPVRAFPWWAIVLASPIVRLFREMREMRYLWKTPLHMRNDKLVAFLGEEPHTGWDKAVGDTLAGLGCIEDRKNPTPRLIAHAESGENQAGSRRRAA